MKLCKYLFIGICLLAFVIGGIRIVSLNQTFPSPKNVESNMGDTFLFHGLEITAGTMEIYSREEFQAAYPEIPLSEDVQYEDGKLTYIIVNIEIRNPGKDEISIDKSSVTGWLIESEGYSNGVPQDLFLNLNPDYGHTFYAEKTKKVKLPFTILSKDVTMKELEEIPLRIVYSYYPTKNYISYDSQSKTKEPEIYKTERGES